MIKSVIMWVLQHIFKTSTQTNNLELNLNEQFVGDYERIDEINFGAIFSNKIANYIANDSSINIIGENARAELLDMTAQSMWRKVKKIASMGLGYGGVFIIPYVKGGKIFYNLVPQNRVTIDEIVGDDITAMTVLAEQKIVNNITSEDIYLRWTNYKIEKSNLTITQKFTDKNGKEIDIPSFWADIQEVMSITNVEKVPAGYIKSPINNRRANDKYGVPITFGCESIINEIKECLKQIQDEFDLKQAFVGVDYTMFKKDKNGNEVLPSTKLFKKFNSDKDDMWELFSPDIRQSSYYERLTNLFSLLEKQVGTSAGILTEIQTENATATAIRRSMYDTFTIVDDMRDNIEKGMEDFFYACDILANAYNITPMGEYEINYDWDYTLLEDSQETFDQLQAGKSAGVVKDVELRQFIFPSETLDEAQKAIDEIKEEEPDTLTLLQNNNFNNQNANANNTNENNDNTNQNEEEEV